MVTTFQYLYMRACFRGWVADVPAPARDAAVILSLLLAAVVMTVVVATGGVVAGALVATTLPLALVARAATNSSWVADGLGEALAGIEHIAAQLLRRVASFVSMVTAPAASALRVACGRSRAARDQFSGRLHGLPHVSLSTRLGDAAVVAVA